MRPGSGGSRHDGAGGVPPAGGRLCARVRAGMTMAESFEQRCIISGIGQSEVGRRVTRGVMALTLDACLEAIADAGLKPADIDGAVSWPGAITRAEGLAPPGPGSPAAGRAPALAA